MSQSASNHAKAPVCAAFVKDMREAFGEVQVLYVKEGEFELGEPAPGPWGYFVREAA